MEQKVVLDEKSFKALSADSRVNILKKLTERRMTLSELSKRLSLRDSTIKEHCNILVNAELIKQIDEGRKWKYYELTGKGRQIALPNPLQEAKVFVMLCIGAIIFASIILFALQGVLLNNSYNLTPIYQMDNSLKATQEYYTATSPAAITETLGETAINTENITERNTNTLFPGALFAAILISLLIGIALGWETRKKL